jgi:light-regulated signal transduction histidine kinase (bacteriophytochrome)
LFVAHVTPANKQERAQVKELAKVVQEVICGSSLCGSGLHRRRSQNGAEEAGIGLIVVKLPEAKKSFILFPRHWVVDSIAWTTHLRCLASDFER